MCAASKGDRTRQDGVEDTKDHGLQVKQLQTDAAELRDAQPHKHVIGVKQTAQYLCDGNGETTLSLQY